MPNHLQVPFVTAKGAFTTVDKGLYRVLSELRRLGVETQYSCQGSRSVQNAYVLADRKTFSKVLCRIYVAYRSGKLTGGQKELVRNFLRGYREYIVRTYTPAPHTKIIRTIIRFGRSFGTKTPTAFCIEQSYSNLYGARTTLRWPAEWTENVLDLLRSLK